MMLLRRLSAASAGSGRLVRRGLSTAASQPPWAMIENAKIRASSAQRASIELAQPPASSHLVVPEHLVGLDPELPLYADSDILGTVVRHAGATSGDGLLLLDFMHIRGTARVVARHRTGAGTEQRKLTGLSFNVRNQDGDTQERRLAGINLDPDITRFVCNPISGELFRLPDVDGTKKTMYCHHIGLVTRSTHGRGRGPPDKFAVAALGEDLNGKERGFVMRRFLSQTGEWDKLVGLPSPLPLARQLSVHTHHEVLAFAGRVWWVDLGWGVLSADPFSDRPELRFIELPRGSVLRVPTTGEDFTAVMVSQGMYRRMGISEGRLRYVEMSQKKPFLLSSFALDEDCSCWMLEDQVELGRLLANVHPWQEQTPWIGAIDPMNASAMCVIVGDHVLAIDMDSGEVVGCSHLGQCDWQQRTILIGSFLPCVLPPWLGSSRIPSTGKKEGAENKALADVLVRLGRD